MSLHYGIMLALSALLRRLIDVRPGEVGTLLWSTLFYFCVFTAYYVIRPIRDAIGADSGARDLPWLFTGTLIVMLLANTPYAALVSRLPRLRFISYTYRFFEVNLLVFFALLQMPSVASQPWLGWTFFIWTSVFNLFVISVFWAFMVDVFTREQGARLFGFIAAGATIGAMTGSGITASLVEVIGTTPLLLVSTVLLEVAVFAMSRLSRHAEALKTATGSAQKDGEPVGGGVLTGLQRALGNPYLLGVCLYMLLYTVTSTFLYAQQAELLSMHFPDRAARTAFLAKIAFVVNSIALLMEFFVTGRIIRYLGVALTLSLLPLLSVLGFSVLGLAPTVAALAIFQVSRQAGNYGVARPTRELLFTVLSREDKYKAKNFIDTVVYRVGDQVGIWSDAALRAAGLSIAGIALVAAPISAVWLAGAYWLGRRQEQLARGGTK